MSWINTAYAFGANQAAGQEGNLLTGLAPFALIFLVFYFLLIRPQQKKAKEHKEMLNALKKGDAIITAGGVYGRIVESNGDTVVVDLGETKVTMARSYIAAVPTAKAAGAAPKKDTKKDAKGKAAKAQPEEKTIEAAPEAAPETVEKAAETDSTTTEK